MSSAAPNWMVARGLLEQIYVVTFLLERFAVTVSPADVSVFTLPPYWHNEREREQVRLVNLGFQALRQHMPLCCRTGQPRRPSKVQTL
ncbi:hypothetical protein NDU88_005904 [Pleurodeles waltl]|uniref:BHLH domain-containing protein n=1 Tax=Pleurodeles waltl TaxID=8319 RepID=A0AAV7LQV5_PLEWA|nr:hypothetical protein NDU88_005904 [Pleurodeles waltl]